MSPAQFLKWEAKAPGIDFKVEYVDVAGGDVEAGLLLSQVLFWCLPSKSGKSKLTVERDGQLWIAKEKHEWYRETRLKRARFDSALQVLEDLGIVTSRTYQFSRLRQLHIALNLEVFLYLMSEIIEVEEAG